MRAIILSLLFIFSISLAHAEELVLYRFVTDLSTLKAGDQLVIANPATHEAMGKFPYTKRSHNRDAIPSHFISETELLINPEFIAELVLEGEPDAWLLKDEEGYLSVKKEGKNELFVTSSPSHSRRNGDKETFLTISLSSDNRHHNFVFNVKSSLSWIPKQLTYNSGLYSCYSKRDSEVALYRRERIVDAIVIDELKTATYYYGTKAFALPEGLTAYTIHANNGALIKGRTYKGAQILPANQAMIIEGLQGLYLLKEASTSEVADSENLLRGSDVRQSIEAASPNEKLYKLSIAEWEGISSLGFYWDNETGDRIVNRPHKAYLAFIQSPTSTLHFISMPAPITMGITAIQQVYKNDVIYNLSGQKVTRPVSGIYIINGKKVYLK
ncbi:hypothetical protein [Hoylesella nanceiensis]|uniref:hypothetical protein n=1 Tax=Hoylesella nanceiensis TaxID=425941 RepID=UPI001CB1978E|nr:hypothetical protein [Hoylesella nanceiensis]MBF1440519.1 hypothetical protein [Hoylesella nanceiensis]